MHALIVGIDKFNVDGLPGLTRCVNGAKHVAKYLEDTLLVPQSQITMLLDSDATKDKILEKLKGFADGGHIAEGAPIVIYFATHTFVEKSTDSMYLVPYLEEREPRIELDNLLAYDSVAEILNNVSEQKSDNIILILDTCHAGGSGADESRTMSDLDESKEGHFHDRLPRDSVVSSIVENKEKEDLNSWPQAEMASSKSNPLQRVAVTPATLTWHSSHILLAGTYRDARSQLNPDEEGLFTRTLLDVLKNARPRRRTPWEKLARMAMPNYIKAILDARDRYDGPGELNKMTYEELVERINREISPNNQQASCTSMYQNRRLFNGLFARRLNEDSSMPLMTVRYYDVETLRSALDRLAHHDALPSIYLFFLLAVIIA
ncbi:hypothetical protein NMY22_g6593 [Coprinellus aureogranulatus]|nr:hypothetical protein NMY22_g6593 [Coprinellus aureogranulatus]